MGTATRTRATWGGGGGRGGPVAVLVSVVVSALGLGLFTFAAQPAAHACGGGLVTISQGSVGANAQRIFISARSNNTTEVVTEIGVPASSQDYGVLLPLPAPPTLDPLPVPAEELAALTTATAPRIVEDGSDGGGGCGCPLGAGGASKAGGGDRGVQIGAPVNIGPVTAVVLDATSPDALTEWLAANAFVVPEASLPLISTYSGSGRTFVAIRRSTTATSTAPSSVGVHLTLPGDARDLPLRFARLGAATRVAFTLFVAAPVATGPSAPFEALTINDLDGDDLKTVGYADAVFRAIGGRQGRAFVVEAAFPAAPSAGSPSPLGSRLGGLVDAAAIVTRMSAVFSADTLTEDVTFRTPTGRPIPTSRTIAAAAQTNVDVDANVNVNVRGGALASAGTMFGLPLLVAVCLLRARRPRR